MRGTRRLPSADPEQPPALEGALLCVRGQDSLERPAAQGGGAAASYTAPPVREPGRPQAWDPRGILEPAPRTPRGSRAHALRSCHVLVSQVPEKLSSSTERSTHACLAQQALCEGDLLA